MNKVNPNISPGETRDILLFDILILTLRIDLHFRLRYGFLTSFTNLFCYLSACCFRSYDRVNWANQCTAFFRLPAV